MQIKMNAIILKIVIIFFFLSKGNLVDNRTPTDISNFF